MTTLGIYRDEDIPAILDDMGVYVQLGRLADVTDPVPGTTPKGLLDENDQAIADDAGRLGVVTPMRMLTVRSTDFPSTVIDDALVLTNPNDFTDRLQCYVSNRLKESDAALSRWVLRVVV